MSGFVAGAVEFLHEIAEVHGHSLMWEAALQLIANILACS